MLLRLLRPGAKAPRDDPQGTIPVWLDRASLVHTEPGLYRGRMLLNHKTGQRFYTLESDRQGRPIRLDAPDASTVAPAVAAPAPAVPAGV